jgi:hypothetical protein
MPLLPGKQEILDNLNLAGDAVSAAEYYLWWEDEYFNDKSCSITKTLMDLAHFGMNLSYRSSNYNVADVAQPRNMSESQHGNDDSERNSTIVQKPVE